MLGKIKQFSKIQENIKEKKLFKDKELAFATLLLFN